MVSRRFCVLLLLSLAFQHSFGLKAIVVFGGEEAKGLRANWIDAVKATVSEAKAHHVADTDMTYFFNGNQEEMAALANHGFKVDGTAANVHLNQPTKNIYDAIATQAHADDLLLLLFGHGIFGNGAVDMNGGRSSPAPGITPVGGKNILDHIDGTHHTVIVHVSCYGGSAWKDHKATMTQKHVVAFTMEEKYPADGEKSMAMAKWITPVLLCNGVFSSLLGGGSMPRALEQFKKHHGKDATSQDIANFKDVVKMTDVAEEYKTVCKAGYSEYHHPRVGAQERQCYVYPDALDFKLKDALPSRRCN